MCTFIDKQTQSIIRNSSAVSSIISCAPVLPQRPQQLFTIGQNGFSHFPLGVLWILPLVSFPAACLPYQSTDSRRTKPKSGTRGSEALGLARVPLHLPFCHILSYAHIVACREGQPCKHDHQTGQPLDKQVGAGGIGGLGKEGQPERNQLREGKLR